MKKVEVRFSDDAHQNLMKLQSESSSSTKSETIRKALNVYNALQNMKDKDDMITISKDGKLYKMILP
jgi:predicted CopG family antitoxin